MLYGSESMLRFTTVDLGEDAVPDASTILRFRHLLEQDALTSQIFDTVRAWLEDHRLLLTAGTIVDATIIAAPSSTKNATQTRDPDMTQTRKGNQRYGGMKMHTGTDTRGLGHSLTTTDAATADIKQVDDLLHGHETTLYGDKAYAKEADRQQWERDGGRSRINRLGPRTAYWDGINRARSRVRAGCEHVFHVLKRLWGFTKVRYRGLAKNTRGSSRHSRSRTCTWFATKSSRRARSVAGSGVRGANHRPAGLPRPETRAITAGFPRLAFPLSAPNEIARPAITYSELR